MKLRVRLDGNSCIRYLFEFAWIYPTLVTTVIDTLMRVLGLSEYSNIARCVVVFYVIIFCSRGLLSKLTSKHLLLYALAVVLYFLFAWIYPQTAGLMLDNAIDVLIFTIPVFFLGISMTDVKLNIGRITLYSRIIILLMSFVFFFMSDINAHEGHMGRAYLVLPSVMLVVYQAFREKKIHDILIGILGCFFLVACTTRGPVLLLLIFVLVIAFVNKIRFLQVVLLLAVIIMSSSSFRTLLINAGIMIFNKFGLNTRIFDMLALGEVTSDNGRNYLEEVVWEMLHEHPISGNGVFSDRIATSALQWIGEDGVYAHNILLECWCQYGYIIGSILLIGLLVVCIYSLFHEQGDKRTILCILILSYIGKLFMSSSYLLEPYFFLTVGMCGSSFSRRQKKVGIWHI